MVLQSALTYVEAEWPFQSRSRRFQLARGDSGCDHWEGWQNFLRAYVFPQLFSPSSYTTSTSEVTWTPFPSLHNLDAGDTPLSPIMHFQHVAKQRKQRYSFEVLSPTKSFIPFIFIFRMCGVEGGGGPTTLLLLASGHTITGLPIVFLSHSSKLKCVGDGTRKTSKQDLLPPPHTIHKIVCVCVDRWVVCLCCETP